MKRSDFSYALPDELIAQKPLSRRDKARLLVIDRHKNTFVHDVFSNLGAHLPARSCLVLNNSKVVPARLLGKRTPTGGEVEIFLLKRLDDGYSYEAMMRPLKRLKTGETISFARGQLTAQVIDKDRRIVRFNTPNIMAALRRIGHMPLPPYIKRPDDRQDRKDYQTVYAKTEGSVAAPTAGLHFTKSLLGKLNRQGHTEEFVTLHVNYATFKPVEVDRIEDHPMHEEEYSMAASAWQRVKKAREAGRNVVAVGTTSCRVLETIATTGRLHGKTDMFIYPGYPFKTIDMLVTNFHLPESTLLMLVYAFGSSVLMRKAYEEAIAKRYRFYSYGDAMLIK